MLNKKNGQAKILTDNEICQLLRVGFVCARDQALFMFCLYTACRISEARQMPIRNAFHNGEVLDVIVIPKEITKGKQGTREIPTHPSLAKFLENYYRESLYLLELRKAFGNWSSWTSFKDGKIVVDQSLQCPRCGSSHLTHYGTYRYKTQSGTSPEEPYYFCKACRSQFRESTAIKNETDEPKIAVYDTLGVPSSINYGFLFAEPDNPFLFTGRGGKGCLSLSGTRYIFDTAFEAAEIIGASSHSCRRTALTKMHAAGIPLRVLQEISGHKDLDTLQKYLEVTPDEVADAINKLG